MFPFDDIIINVEFANLCKEPSYIMYIFPSRIFCSGVEGFVNGCPHGVWAVILLVVRLGKSILIKLVYKFDGMANNFVYYVHVYE